MEWMQYITYLNILSKVIFTVILNFVLVPPAIYLYGAERMVFAFVLVLVIHTGIRSKLMEEHKW